MVLIDTAAEKRDPFPPIPRPESDVRTTRPNESYSVYEAPRRYDRTVESIPEFEPDAVGEATLNDDDWADVPEPDTPWNENKAMDESNAGDAARSDDVWADVPEPNAPWNENEAVYEPTIAQPEEEADDDSWIPHTVSGAVQKRTVEINPDLSLPLIQYQAIYQLGDDFFDETFSIDELDDEFIGECGIGIAETINTTEPKAVTAFEAWLFDRQDTVTPTVFLLSDYAYRQPEMLERLKNKGQFELMQVGKKIEVETFALKMTLTISEIIYGTESSDPRSYFDKVVFDVKVTRKEAN